MKRLVVLVVAFVAAVALVLSGCGQSAPAPAATKAPEPTKAAAPAATSAPAAPVATKAPEATKPAAAAWPEKGKAISIIVPYPAGGGTDLGARVMAALLEKEFGTPVQVVNRGGAGGQIGVTEALAAKADGYTIGYMNWPQVIPFYMDPDRKAAFTRQSILPVAVHLSDPISIAVNAKSPYQGLKDLIDAAKANPDKIKAGDDGIMSLANLSILQMQQLTGAKFANVHFDGGAPSVAALLGEHIDASLGGSNLYQPQVKSGGLRVIAILDTEGTKFLPDVKTARAQGFEIISPQVRGYFVPAGTPAGVVDTLVAGMKRVMDSEEHKKKIDELGQVTRFMGPTEFEALWKEMEAQQKPLLEMAKQQ